MRMPAVRGALLPPSRSWHVLASAWAFNQTCISSHSHPHPNHHTMHLRSIIGLAGMNRATEIGEWKMEGISLRVFLCSNRLSTQADPPGTYCAVCTLQYSVLTAVRSTCTSVCRVIMLGHGPSCRARYRFASIVSRVPSSSEQFHICGWTTQVEG
jgi:hypothetical protein